jgi:hypothetical protein
MCFAGVHGRPWVIEDKHKIMDREQWLQRRVIARPNFVSDLAGTEANPASFCKKSHKGESMAFRSHASLLHACVLLATFLCQYSHAFSFSGCHFQACAGKQILPHTYRTKPSRNVGAVNMMSARSQGSKTPLILCPAQFGTPADYVEIVELLSDRGFQTYIAPLSRIDWLRIVPSTNIRDYIAAELKPSKTLGFYYKVVIYI